MSVHKLSYGRFRHILTSDLHRCNGIYRGIYTIYYDNKLVVYIYFIHSYSYQQLFNNSMSAHKLSYWRSRHILTAELNAFKAIYRYMYTIYYDNEYVVLIYVIPSYSHQQLFKNSMSAHKMNYWRSRHILTAELNIYRYMYTTYYDNQPPYLTL